MSASPAGRTLLRSKPAVDNAQPGDVIKVAAATYIESKLVSGTPYNLYITKTLIIRGGYTCADFHNQNPSPMPRPFVLPPAWNQSFRSSECSEPRRRSRRRLTALPSQAAAAETHGGGISMRDSDATISNNIITGNIGYLLGGGI